MWVERTYYIYILSSHSRVLYTGVTNNLLWRVAQHKAGLGSRFTARYKANRLVYYECFAKPRHAIAREKQIKAGSRADKIRLIESKNRDWRDLSDDFEIASADYVKAAHEAEYRD